MKEGVIGLKIFIGGGTNNCIRQTSNSAIVSGVRNTASNATQMFIGGGVCNTIAYGSCSAIVIGSNNYIGQSNTTIAGGSSKAKLWRAMPRGCRTQIRTPTRRSTGTGRL